MANIFQNIITRKLLTSKFFFAVTLAIVFSTQSCNIQKSGNIENIEHKDEVITEQAEHFPLNSNEEIPEIISSSHDIDLYQYFEWMDSTITDLNKDRNYEIDEYLLVRSNPQILERLVNSDYYFLADQGIFIEDPKSTVVIHKDEPLQVPDSVTSTKLRESILATSIDVNIPEFKLRIFEEDHLIYEFQVRVGKDKKEYLAMVGRPIDLRTKTGNGRIFAVVKNPTFINPKNNHIYKVTRRDDGKVTKLPNIPWLEPEIDGQRHGQLIHPTTNLRTIGHPASNGCIGLRESDAWILYYFAPIGTKINIRYDLNIIDEDGLEISLPEIYDD